MISFLFVVYFIVSMYSSLQFTFVVIDIDNACIVCDNDM